MLKSFVTVFLHYLLLASVRYTISFWVHVERLINIAFIGEVCSHGHDSLLLECCDTVQWDDDEMVKYWRPSRNAYSFTFYFWWHEILFLTFVLWRIWINFVSPLSKLVISSSFELKNLLNHNTLNMYSYINVYMYYYILVYACVAIIYEDYWYTTKNITRCFVEMNNASYRMLRQRDLDMLLSDLILTMHVQLYFINVSRIFVKQIASNFQSSSYCCSDFYAMCKVSSCFILLVILWIF